MAGKKKKIKLISTVIIIAVLIVSGIITAVSNGSFEDLLYGSSAVIENKDGLYVSFIDVGQGDCTLITCKDTSILIDSGESSEYQTVINFLNRNRIKDLDLVILTHPHSDHMGSMYRILRRYPIGDVIMSELPDKLVPTTDSYERFLNAVSLYATEVIPAAPGKSYKYGELQVDILGPLKDYGDLNNMSVVAKITYGETSVMMTGDAQTDSEKDMLRKNSDFKADLLKVGHHGSKNASSDAWLKAVSPEYAVISCGMNNDYHHPHKTTLNKLEKQSVEYFRTDLLGDIVFFSDGKTFEHVVREAKNK